MTQEIARAGGKVFIGFKDSSAAAGVNERGTTLVDRTVVEAMNVRLRGQGVMIERVYRIVPAVAATIVPESVAELLANPRIEYVEPRFAVAAIVDIQASRPETEHGLSALRSPHLPIEMGARPYDGIDPSLDAADTSWNIRRVKADSVWSTTTGSGVKLLIMDNGTYAHSDLSYEDITACGQNEASNFGSHGVKVSGVVAAGADAFHLVGVAPQVSLYSIAVGEQTFSESDVLCALEYADSVGVDVINMSIKFNQTTPLNDALNLAYSAGVVLVASAGNDGTNKPVVYPAKWPAVIAVGATKEDDSILSLNQESGSHTGPEIFLVAPGYNIPVLCRLSGVDSTCIYHGTSFSAPHVAGAAALLRSYNSSWTPAEIRRRLALSAKPLGAAGRDNTYGYGLLDIKGALQAAAPNPPSVSIDGPTSVRPFETCTWTASASGGVTPLSYSSSPTFSSSHVLTYQNGSNHGEQFTVTFQATGTDLAIGITSLTVSVSTNAPECIS